MIEIRYSAPYSLDVSGTASELSAVRDAIRGLAKSSPSQLAFDADESIDPTPYNAAFSKLVLTVSAGATKVSVANGDEIHISGSPDCLEALASFFNFRAGATKGDHSHFEYYDGNDFIASDSVPLVISVK